MKRREFIKYGSQIGLIGYLSRVIDNPLFAQVTHDNPIKNLIYLSLEGGWDVTLGLDPQIKKLDVSDVSLFLGYRENEILKADGLNLGPAAHGFREFAGNTIAVNGVSMLGNVSHGDCARWAQSGFIERRSAGIPAMFSVSIAESNELAMVVVDGGGSVEEGSFHVSQVRTGDVKNMTKPESLASDYVFLEPDSIDAMSRRMSVRYGERIKVLCDKNPELRSILNGGSTSGNAMAATALAFLSGFARAAVFNIRPTTGLLDTHTGHARIHASALKNCFEQVFDFVRFLQKSPSQDGTKSLFDETLIVITSEFSREINLNSSSVETGGKEHNGYTNSYVLMSGGLRGGFTIGESTIQPNILHSPVAHIARNFDFDSGQAIHKLSDAPERMADPKAIKQIRPGHVVRSVAALMGFEGLLDPTLRDLPKLRFS